MRAFLTRKQFALNPKEILETTQSGGRANIRQNDGPTFSGKSTLHIGAKYATIHYMRNTRPISWIKAARKDFDKFPEDVQADMFYALTMAAEGCKADMAKPFKGVDGGVFEIALKYQGNASLVVYAVKIGPDVWVIHAFQKKSKTGIKTPHAAVDLIKDRLKRLTEALQ